MRMIFSALLLFGILAASGVAEAEVAAPYSGMKTVETGTPFGTYVKKLKSAIGANKMGIVAHACANCGAKAIGVTIPANNVIMIYHPRFAVRMLKASVASGIEAPLRLYVTEMKDGTARLTYRFPMRRPPAWTPRVKSSNWLLAAPAKPRINAIRAILAPPRKRATNHACDCSLRNVSVAGQVRSAAFS